MAPSIKTPRTPNSSARCCRRMDVFGSTTSMPYSRANAAAPITPGSGSKWMRPAMSRATTETYFI